ncbi:MAG: pitrilysin family protein [Pseudomonadota bacterium]|nr:pitrilysin family protein [Pseudomonadota bacterium]
MTIQTISTKSATYHILPTNHKGFITGCCMVPAGNFHVEFAQRVLPSLLANALGLGTKDKTEEAFHELLEGRGIILHTSVSSSYMTVKFTCLSQDFAMVASLISEQLNEPRLDPSAIDNLKNRVMTRYNALRDDTAYQASAKFTQILYPKEHMLRADTPEDMVQLVKEVTATKLKTLHKSYHPLHHAKWIVVGDIDSQEVMSILNQYASDDGVVATESRAILDGLPSQEALEKVIVKDKQSVDVRIGHVLPIDIHHPEYLPLRLAIDALGGSFSARLMRTVRDEDGLTYNVGSKLAGFIPHHGGHWMVYGSFSPKLLDKGIQSIQKQLNLWYKNGISAEELEERKLGMVGRYQVMLSDAESLVDKLATNIESGFDIDYLYSFSEKVMSVSLEEVNSALKKHIHIDRLTSVYAGSI